MRLLKIGTSLLALLLSTSLISALDVIPVRAQTSKAQQEEVADKLFEQGLEQLNHNQLEEALQSWQQALPIYREIKDRKKERVVLANIGLVYYYWGKYAKAVEYQQQSLTIAREIQDRKGEATVLGNLGVSYLDLGDYTQAVSCFEQQLAIARQLSDRRSEASALGNLGIVYGDRSEYAQAIEYQKQSLTIQQEIGNRQGVANALSNIGMNYHALGDNQKALDYFQQALAIRKEIKDLRGEANSYNNLGNIYYDLSDYPKSSEYYQQSLDLARQLQDPEAELDAISNLGRVENALGRYRQAIDYYQQGWQIATKTQNLRKQGMVAGNLGDVYKHLGNYAQAIEYQQQSLAIAQKLQDKEGESAALGDLGLTYYTIGNFDRAIKYQQQSLAIAKEIRSRQQQASSLNNLGSAYSSLGEYAKAAEYYQQSLALAKEIKDKKSEGDSVGNLALAYYYLGDYTKAIDYNWQCLTIAREIKDRESESIGLRSLGMIYRALGDYPQAISYQQQSLAIAQEIKDPQGEGESLNNLSNALRLSGDLPAAETAAKQAIKIWEELRANLGNNDANKVSIFNEQLRTYRLLQEILIGRDRPEAALEIAELGRARALTELLASGNKQLPELTSDRLKQIAKAQNATLVQYSIIYADFSQQGKLESQESELYIWAIKPTGEIAFRQVDLKPLWQQQKTSLENLVSSSRAALGTRGRGGIEVVPVTNQNTTRDRLQQLHQLLIAPIATALPPDANAKVIFIPQGSLFLVPFAALIDNEGKYLIERHTILAAPSIQVLELTRDRRQKVSGKGALVVGNPQMPKVTLKIGEPPEQLPQLPGAEQEAKAIAKLLQTQALIGKQATKAAVLQQISQAKTIHLATHGLLDDVPGTDVPGAIALAPNASDSGLLSAAEILKLKLNAELAVLSACDTGSGKITGEGVIGLSRSLIAAGVPSVVVSLWAVSDNATAALMAEFYRQLQQQPDKAQALRQAMLVTMKKYPDPLDWAAFTLIGEAQ